MRETGAIEVYPFLTGMMGFVKLESSICQFSLCAFEIDKNRKITSNTGKKVANIEKKEI